MLVKQSDDFYVNVYSRSSEVTGNCNLNSVHFPNGKNFRFLVECGLFQGNSEEQYLNQYVPFDAKKISAVFITHNHIDHTGLLPVLVKQGYEGPIFTTYATYRLIDVALYDSCKIRNSDIGEQLYSSIDVENTLAKLVGCRYKTIIKPHKYVHAVFYSNGHLLGSAIVHIKISYPGREDINLIYTGDYNNKNMFFNVESLPKRLTSMKISAIFTESTYGDMDSNDPRLAPYFEKNLITAINDGKTVVLPAFSQGRYQEILLYLRLMQSKGTLPITVPIWLDGFTGQEYTKRYMNMDLGIKKLSKNFMPKNVHFVPFKDRRKIREELIADVNSKIILAPGGMGNYGSIQKYISNLISSDNVLIHYLGYCSPESRAFELINADYGDAVNYAGMTYIKRASVKWTGEYSAHAKRNEVLAFILQFDNVNAILITHGDELIRKKFAAYLHYKLDSSIQIGILNPEYAYHVTSDGVTTKPAHFEI